MKLLADENFPRPTVLALRGQGLDVLWARTDCPGLKDRGLLELAEADGRVVLTLDQDFWQLALQRPLPLKRCGVILFRCHPAIPKNLDPLVASALGTDHPWVGHVSMVKPEGVEMILVGGDRAQ
jgi:predicted nuclease of predicted toxin-antitoxin system